MQVDFNKEYMLRISDIFNGVELVSPKERLCICQRDGGFEIIRIKEDEEASFILYDGEVKV